MWTSVGDFLLHVFVAVPVIALVEIASLFVMKLFHDMLVDHKNTRMHHVLKTPAGIAFSDEFAGMMETVQATSVCINVTVIALSLMLPYGLMAFASVFSIMVCTVSNAALYARYRLAAERLRQTGKVEEAGLHKAPAKKR